MAQASKKISKRSVFKAEITIREYGTIYEEDSYNRTATSTIDSNLLSIKIENADLQTLMSKLIAHIELTEEINLDSPEQK